MVDINQDGWLDIYVCSFSEQAKAYGLADTGHTVQAAFFDYDHDNDLDHDSLQRCSRENDLTESSELD